MLKCWEILLKTTFSILAFIHLSKNGHGEPFLYQDERILKPRTEP